MSASILLVTPGMGISPAGNTSIRKSLSASPNALAKSSRSACRRE